MVASLTSEVYMAVAEEKVLEAEMMHHLENSLELLEFHDLPVTERLYNKLC